MDTTSRQPPEPSPTRIQTLNRDAIVRAAMPLFARNGFRGATLDLIAAAAGMSKPNLLYYFRNKEALYAAVLEDTLEHWLAPLEGLSVDGDPVDELRRYIEAKMRISAESPEASRLFASEILAGAPLIRPVLETRLRTLVREKTAIIDLWIADGRLAPVDPVHLIFAIWAVTQHYADFAVQVQAILGDEARQPDFAARSARAVLAIILNGITPRSR